MLRIFCRDHHQTPAQLCVECLGLRDYAHRRLDACPFQANKPACNKCTVHCYAEKKRAQVKEVMRYAGPRMLLRHPVLAVLHLLDLIAKAPELKKRR